MMAESSGAAGIQDLEKYDSSSFKANNTYIPFQKRGIQELLSETYRKNNGDLNTGHQPQSFPKRFFFQFIFFFSFKYGTKLHFTI